MYHAGNLGDAMQVCGVVWVHTAGAVAAARLPLVVVHLAAGRHYVCAVFHHCHLCFFLCRSACSVATLSYAMFTAAGCVPQSVRWPMCWLCCPQTGISHRLLGRNADDEAAYYIRHNDTLGDKFFGALSSLGAICFAFGGHSIMLEIQVLMLKRALCWMY